MTLNTDISAALAHLDGFLNQGDWPTRLDSHRDALLRPILTEARIDVPELFTLLERDGLLMQFKAYLDEAFVCARLEPDSATPIDAYLKRRGWQETPRARAYLQGMRDAVPAVWEVRATAPGAWVDVSDRLGEGGIVRVSERSASQMLQRYDRMLARVVPIRGEHLFTGGVLMLTHDVADGLEAKLRRLAKSGKPTREAVVATCLQHWTIALLRFRSGALPELQTTHGESLVLGRTRLMLAAGATSREVGCRLNEAEPQGWVRMGAASDEPGWIWFKPPADGGGASRDQPHDGVTDAPSMTHRTILATVRADGPDAFVLETMSRARMERALRSLDAVLEGLVTHGLTNYEDPLQALRRRRERDEPRSTGEESHAVRDPDFDAAETAEILRQITVAHYRRTLDDEVPMLGHRTPRECCRTKAGRKKLVAWLKYLENAELHRAAAHGQAPLDFDWMWRELGVANER